MKRKFTVYFEQINRTNYQVLAVNIGAAIKKAEKLYRKDVYIPGSSIEEGWIKESDGEDK